MKSEEKLLSIRQAAAELAITEGAVYAMCRSSRLPFTVVNGVKRIRESVLRAFAVEYRRLQELSAQLGRKRV